MSHTRNRQLGRSERSVINRAAFGALFVLGVVSLVTNFWLGSWSLLIASALTCWLIVLLFWFRDAHGWDYLSPLPVGIGSLIMSYPAGVVWAMFTDAYTDEEMRVPLLLVVAMALMVPVGITLALRMRWSVPWKFSDSGNESRILFGALVFPLIGVGSYVLFLWVRGYTGLSDIIENLLAVRLESTLGGMYYLKFLWENMVRIPLLILVASLLVRKRKSFAVGRRALILAGLSVLFLLALLSGSRAQVLTIVLSLVVLYHCLVRRHSLGLILGILILFAPFAKVYSEFRYASFISPTRVSLGIDDVLQMSRGVRVYDIANIFIWRISVLDELVQWWPVEKPFLYGASIWHFVVQPIPRPLWPEKPYLFSYQMTRLVSPSMARESFSESFGLVPEMYLNFHIPGLLLGGLIYGLAIGHFQRMYNKNRKNLFFVLLYSQLFLTPWGWLTSGLINSSMNIVLLLTVAFCFPLFVFLQQKPVFVRRSAS